MSITLIDSKDIPEYREEPITPDKPREKGLKPSVAAGIKIVDSSKIKEYSPEEQVRIQKRENLVAQLEEAKKIESTSLVSKLLTGIHFEPKSDKIKRQINYIDNKTSLLEQYTREGLEHLKHETERGLFVMQFVPKSIPGMVLTTGLAQAAIYLLEGEKPSQILKKSGKDALFTYLGGKMLGEVIPALSGVKAASKEVIRGITKGDRTLRAIGNEYKAAKLTSLYMAGEVSGETSLLKQVENLFSKEEGDQTNLLEVSASKGARFLRNIMENSPLAKAERLKNKLEIDHLTKQRLDAKYKVDEANRRLEEHIEITNLKRKMLEDLNTKRQLELEQETQKQYENGLPLSKILTDEKRAKDLALRVEQAKEAINYKNKQEQNPFSLQAEIQERNNKELIMRTQVQEAELDLAQATTKHEEKLALVKKQQEAVELKKLYDEAVEKQKEVDHNLKRKLVMDKVQEQATLSSLIVVAAQTAAENVSDILGQIGKKLSEKYTTILDTKGVGGKILNDVENWADGSRLTVSNYIIKELNKMGPAKDARTVEGALDAVVQAHLPDSVKAQITPLGSKLEKVKQEDATKQIIKATKEAEGKQNLVITGTKENTTVKVEKVGKKKEVKTPIKPTVKPLTFEVKVEDLHHIIQTLEVLGSNMKKNPLNQQEAIEIIFPLKKALQGAMNKNLIKYGGEDIAINYGDLSLRYAQWSGLAEDIQKLGGKGSFGSRYDIKQGPKLAEKLKQGAVDEYASNINIKNTSKEEDIETIRRHLNASSLPYKHYKELIRQTKEVLPESVGVLEQNQAKLFTHIEDEMRLLTPNKIPEEYFPKEALPELEKLNQLITEIKETIRNNAVNSGGTTISNKRRTLNLLIKKQNTEKIAQEMRDRASNYTEETKSIYEQNQARLRLQQAEENKAFDDKITKIKNIEYLVAKGKAPETTAKVESALDKLKEKYQHKELIRQVWRKKSEEEYILEQQKLVSQLSAKEKDIFFNRLANKTYLVTNMNIRIPLKTALWTILVAPMIGREGVRLGALTLESLAKIAHQLPDSRQARLLQGYLAHYKDELDYEFNKLDKEDAEKAKEQQK